MLRRNCGCVKKIPGDEVREHIYLSCTSSAARYIFRPLSRLEEARTMSNWKIARSCLLIVAVLGSLAIAYAMSAAQGGQGPASLSGTVDSAAPFKAAQVYIRNIDKRILYQVYTNEIG